MKEKAMKMSIVLVLSLFVVSSGWAFPEYQGYSGAPGTGGTCAGTCHGSGTGSITISNFPTVYTPNQAYLLTINRLSGSSIANFNGSVRIGTGSSNAGTLTAGTGTSTYNTTGETNGIHFTSNNQLTGTFNWMAPSAGTGDVKLYVAGHQGTYNGPNTVLALVATEEVVGPPPAPGQLVILVAVPNIDLFWQPSDGASSYDVYRGISNPVQLIIGNHIATVADTSYQDVNVLAMPNEIFFYVVTASP